MIIPPDRAEAYGTGPRQSRDGPTPLPGHTRAPDRLRPADADLCLRPSSTHPPPSASAGPSHSGRPPRAGGCPSHREGKTVSQIAREALEFIK